MCALGRCLLSCLPTCFFFFFAGRRSAEPRRPPAHILRKATDWSLIFSFVLSVPLDPPRSTHPRRCPRHSLHVGSLCRHSTPRGPSPSGHPLQPWGTWPAPDTQRTPRSPPSRIFPTPLPNLGIASPQPPRPPRRRDDMERQGRFGRRETCALAQLRSCRPPADRSRQLLRALLPQRRTALRGGMVGARRYQKGRWGEGGVRRSTRAGASPGWSAPPDPKGSAPGSATGSHVRLRRDGQWPALPLRGEVGARPPPPPPPRPLL